MKDSIHKYFQVGLVSAMAYAPVLAQGGDLWPEVIRRIAVDDYFDAVEVNPSPPRRSVSRWPPWRPRATWPCITTATAG